MGYHHGNLTFMCYRCDSLADTDPGGTFAIFLNDDDEFRCGCSGEKICRLGGNRPCVLAKVGMRHRRQVCQVQGKRAARYNERMSTVLEGVVVSLAVESKPPVFSEGISASGGWKEAAPKGRAVFLKRGTSGETFWIMSIFYC